MLRNESITDRLVGAVCVNDEVKPMLGGVERLGMTKGIVQGKQELLLNQLQARFGKVPARLRRRLQAMQDPDVLTELGLRLLTVESLSDFEELLDTPSKR
jgi:hypothetical protein